MIMPKYLKVWTFNERLPEQGQSVLLLDGDPAPWKSYPEPEECKVHWEYMDSEGEWFEPEEIDGSEMPSGYLDSLVKVVFDQDNNQLDMDRYWTPTPFEFHDAD